ncbi:MAG: archease [Actinomycetia bacterium]|nr:archease [Actinomycetes bacterium]
MNHKSIKKSYRLVENLSDMAVEAWGENPEELFASIGTGMFSAITDIDKVNPKFKVDITLEEEPGGSYEDAVISWLQELIYRFEADKMLFCRFEIENIGLDEKILVKACGWGEPVDKERHNINIGIKAATYHQLKVVKNQQWHCKVIFDI